VIACLPISGALAGLAAVRTAEARGLSTAVTSSVDVTATATGFSFTPNEFQDVATNSTIYVNFTDASSVAHTFTIIGKEGWVIPSSITETAFGQLVFGKTPAAVFNLNASGVGTVPGSFKSPGPGWYEFVCTEPGHFGLGMYGFIAFGMNLPANLTVSAASEAPGAALFIIIGTIVTLVVIALVLGFVAGRRKGAQHEMPPERLGYPEPSAGEPPLPTSSGDSRHP
jgi:uncharacterized cupredoxin-like copper-binding protein